MLATTGNGMVTAEQMAWLASLVPVLNALMTGTVTPSPPLMGPAPPGVQQVVLNVASVTTQSAEEVSQEEAVFKEDERLLALEVDRLNEGIKPSPEYKAGHPAKTSNRVKPMG